MKIHYPPISTSQAMLANPDASQQFSRIGFSIESFELFARGCGPWSPLAPTWPTNKKETIEHYNH